MNDAVNGVAPLRFATYLSPNIFDTYGYIARCVGERVGRPATIAPGRSFDAFAAGEVDVGFICGLPYVQLADAPGCPIELLAAPVLWGERYQHRPIYFSDVVVRRESPYTSFDDLRGCVWAYNQNTSHSGWNIVGYSLRDRGCQQLSGYFGRMLETGSHLRSLALVLAGQADATAVDSHVLAVLLASDDAAAASLRVIDALGPSSIPPVVIASSVDRALKGGIQDALLGMHEDPRAARALRAGYIERFVRVSDADYQDIRTMHALLGGQPIASPGRASLMPRQRSHT
jgi:phosphonate transport system substrate-binding protein